MQEVYNELNHVHFKTCNDLKVLQTNLDRLTGYYGKMETINVQQEKNMLELENTYFAAKGTIVKSHH
jgi:hypothetical protein